MAARLRKELIGTAGNRTAMALLAREVAADGITVNGLLPGLMDTGALTRVIHDRVERQGI